VPPATPSTHGLNFSADSRGSSMGTVSIMRAPFSRGGN
jgi:hypothetical protein